VIRSTLTINLLLIIKGQYNQDYNISTRFFESKLSTLLEMQKASQLTGFS
jgi:hypothetical protein